MIDVIQNIFKYFSLYYQNICLSLLYFSALSFIGVFLIWRRASLMGLVITQLSRVLFIIALYIFQKFGIIEIDSDLILKIRHYDILFLCFNFSITSILIYLLIYIEKNKINNKESILAILLIAMFGVEPIIHKTFSVNADYLNTIYFSEILYSSSEIIFYYLSYILFFILLLILNINRIFLVAFDPYRSHIIGLKTGLYNFIFYFVVMGVISISIRVMTSYLAMTMLLIPSYLAVCIAKSRIQAYLLSVFFAILFGFIGFSISFYFDTLPTESIIMSISLILFFILYFFVKK